MAETDISQLYKVELHTQRYSQLGKVPVWCDHVTVTCSDKKLFVIGGYQMSDNGSTKFPSDLVQVIIELSGSFYDFHTFIYVPSL